MDVAFLLDKYFKGARNVSINHKLIVKDGKSSVIENGFWQGTLIYMIIATAAEIDPNQIVDHRADAAEQYNEAFVETGELESLW